MSVLNLDGGVTFCPESKEFTKETCGKKFTSTSWKGALKQAEQHEQMMITRESLRDDMIPVSTIFNDVSTECGKPVLYHVPSERVYDDLPAGLERRDTGDMPWFPLVNLEQAKELRRSEITIEKNYDEVNLRLNDVRSKLRALSLPVRPDNKQAYFQHHNPTIEES